MVDTNARPCGPTVMSVTNERAIFRCRRKAGTVAER